MTLQFDVIVIGSGGGSKITRPAANLGLKVAIIENGPLGGTCLNRGCIPSKMLIYPADVAHTIATSGTYHISAGITSIDFEKLVTEVSNTIDAESASIKPVYDAHDKITTYKGHARFVGPKILKVGDIEMSADKIMVAVGASPFIPPIKGLQGTPYMTSKEALRLTNKPKKMIVIGGGYIAVELGFMYQAMGVDVTFLVRGEFITFEDDDVIDCFTRNFSKICTVNLGASPTAVAHKNDEFTVTYTQNGQMHTVVADALLLATGVVPNTFDLGLENTAIELNKKGFIQVNAYLETAVPGVFAFGDVIGKHLFRHSANFEGEYVFQNQFVEKLAKPIDYVPVPYAAFTHPQIAGVGAKEKDLVLSGTPYVVGKNTYKDSAMGMAMKNEDGFVKLLFHKETKKLLGAHIVGFQASVLIHQLIAILTMRGGLDDVLGMIYIHPALSEIVRNAGRKAKAIFDQNA